MCFLARDFCFFFNVYFPQKMIEKMANIRTPCWQSSKKKYFPHFFPPNLKNHENKFSANFFLIFKKNLSYVLNDCHVFSIYSEWQTLNCKDKMIKKKKNFSQKIKVCHKVVATPTSSHHHHACLHCAAFYTHQGCQVIKYKKIRPNLAIRSFKEAKFSSQK